MLNLFIYWKSFKNLCESLTLKNVKACFLLDLCFPASQIKKNDLLTTLPKWGPTWRVQFELTVHSYPPEDTYVGVLALTTGDNCCDVGDRIPTIQLHNDQILILNAVDNYGNDVVQWTYQTDKPQFIEIMQTFGDDDKVSLYFINI